MKKRNLNSNSFKIFTILIFTLSSIFLINSNGECKPTGGVKLEGIITCSQSAALISNASVTAGGRTVKSDENGHYIISGLLPGKIIIEIKKAGYENYDESIRVTKGTNSFNVKLKAARGQVERCAIITEDRSGKITAENYDELIRESRRRRSGYQNKNAAVSNEMAVQIKGRNYITGKVIDMASGVPVSRAKINIDGEIYFSDTSGEFISKPIIRSQAMIRAESPAYNAYESNIKITGGKNKLKILLMPLPQNSMAYTGFDQNKIIEYSKFSQRYASISGHVRDAKTRNPIINATVIIAAKSAQTNSQGFYTIDGLAMGHADVTIIAGNYGVYKGNVNLTKVSNLNDVALSAEEKYSSVSGSVIEKETGRPIHGAKIQIGNKIVVSDQYGTFNIKDIAYDYYNLMVEQKGYQRIEKAMSVNQESINVTVELADEYQIAK